MELLRKIGNRKALLGTVIIVIIAAIVILPIKVPYSVSAYCKIQPAKKWLLTMGTNGQLLSTVFDFKEGMSGGVKASQFAREGTMKLTFNPLLTTGRMVEIGDTIGSIYSSDTEEQLADLRGQISTMKASLESANRGDKESVIREYESKVAQAEEAVANQRLIVNRLKALLESNLVSQQEYEIAEGREKVLAKEIDIARSQLETARTGVKPEEAALTAIQIAALEDQLAAVNRRVESFALISPIAGTVSRSYSADTLMMISDIADYIAIIPVKANEFPYIDNANNVGIFYNGTKSITGQIIHLDNEIHIMKGQQTRYATATIVSNKRDLPLGILSKCIIKCKPITIAEYLRRFLLS